MKTLIIVFIVAAFSAPLKADLVPYKDYEKSDAVWVLTTVKVKENMTEAYLEGIRDTWVSGSEMSKKMGHIEDYSIYVSDLAASGDFNLILLTKFANTADLAPNKAKYQAFMKKMGAAKEKQNTERAQRDYPGMRSITGDYMLREVTFK